MRNLCLHTRSAQAKTTLMENSPHSAKIPCEGVLDRMPRKRSIVPETHTWNPFQGKPWRDSKAQNNQPHSDIDRGKHTMEIKNGTWRKGTDPDFMKRIFRIGLGNHRKITIYVPQLITHSSTRAYSSQVLIQDDSRTWKAFSMGAKQKLWHQTIVLTPFTD